VESPDLPDSGRSRLGGDERGAERVTVTDHPPTLRCGPEVNVTMGADRATVTDLDVGSMPYPI